jgi:hypothetical protein
MHRCVSLTFCGSRPGASEVVYETSRSSYARGHSASQVRVRTRCNRRHAGETLRIGMKVGRERHETGLTPTSSKFHPLHSVVEITFTLPHGAAELYSTKGCHGATGL